MYDYDVLVVGAGHAGVEAAAAAARIGARTALLTGNLDTVALMSCNPAVGGIGKGHIVREIDALGGIMGRAIDATGIQFRMLNRRKGPAMQGPRAQADKDAYQREIKRLVEMQENLALRQESVENIVTKIGRVAGVRVADGTVYRAGRVVLCCGTFVRGTLFCGTRSQPGGRAGEAPATEIGEALSRLGIELRRFRTDTPPRLDGRTVDYSRLAEHPGDEDPRPFSFLHDELDPRIRDGQIPCWLCWTNPALHDFIREHLHEAPAFSGRTPSAGPRYCPSIETKIVRFSEKGRHQLFLEPEGRDTCEIYLNGFSTGFGRDMQERMIRKIEGLEKAEIMRFGYAIEYDYAPPEQMKATLESRRVPGLYLAGQLNGTTGYEEAAALGLMAGANAALAAAGREPFVLGREEAYIGVMIDDLVTKGNDEPYRMFTSRAEHRLYLRHDNADRRLTPRGADAGLVDTSRKDRLDRKLSRIDRAKTLLRNNHDAQGSLEKRLSRPETTWAEIVERLPELADIPADAAEQVDIDTKYRGYLVRQEADIERRRKLDRQSIPEDVDYAAMIHLRHEAREKFDRVRPSDLGQASRIPGITPADLAVLTMYLGRR